MKCSLHLTISVYEYTKCILIKRPALEKRKMHLTTTLMRFHLLMTFWLPREKVEKKKTEDLIFSKMNSNDSRRT